MQKRTSTALKGDIVPSLKKTSLTVDAKKN